MTKELLCIVCPTGCRLTAGRRGAEITVTGNGCPRGVDFARTELTAPVRSLTTTVRTAFAAVPVLPVRTAGEIPKEAIPEALAQLARIVVDRPLACGDMVLRNVARTGCDVIAASNILLENEGE
jgi:CxxC motif-containing protein